MNGVVDDGLKELLDQFESLVNMQMFGTAKRDEVNSVMDLEIRELICESISKTLKSERAKRGLEPVQMARLLNVYTKTIESIENHKHMPDAFFIVKMYKYLNLPFEKILLNW